MALPDYIGLVKGTPVEWSTTGGKLITLTSLANNAGREGAKSASWIDATFGLPEVIEIRFESAVAVTATQSAEIELWIGESDSITAGNDNPGNLTGADAAVSTPDELKLQCYWAGSIVLSNGRTTNVQKQRMFYEPVCEFSIPLVVNKSGQALHATAGNHKIIFTPYFRRVKD